MAQQGDTKRARSIKAEMDDSLLATPRGGAAILEKAMRSLSIRRMLSEHLPEREGSYGTEEVVEQIIEGLLMGGRGFDATSVLRSDEKLAMIFGHASVASEPTVYRIMCELAGLEQRRFDQAYVPAGTESVRLDLLGKEKAPRRHVRVVPETPEAMKESKRQSLSTLLLASARRCGQALGANRMRAHGFLVSHLDGTDLEVDGRCFDAARKNYEGSLSLRMMTFRVGPLYTSMRLLAGASDEGRAMPALIEESRALVDELRGRSKSLVLIDAAGGEKPVIDALDKADSHFLIGANGNRTKLESVASDQPEAIWTSQGADASRGWDESQTGVFTHCPEGWEKPVTVVARRWREQGELPTSPWHHSFLYTHLEPKDFPPHVLQIYGFALLCWMLYSTKQGHENHFKTFLSDLGGHHPASGRLGTSEAFSMIAALTANIWAALSYRAAPKEDRGIRLWRFIRDYICVAARVVRQSGRTLLVQVASAGLGEDFKRRWLAMFASAGRL